MPAAAAPPSMWGSTDYALDWPAELLASELAALSANSVRPMHGAEIAILLELAFHTGVPAEHFQEAVGPVIRADPQQVRAWVSIVLDHVHELRQHVPATPLWRARRSGAGEAAPEEIRAQFALLVGELDWHGYFDRDTFTDCPCYEHDYTGELPSLSTLLERRLNQPGVWTVTRDHAIEATWDQETFYELIEVLHDHAARPRERWQHKDESCERHYRDFDTDSGRRIYRSLVNRLLAEHNVGLCLAADGPDEGRLVELVDAAREDLLERALHSPDVPVGERVAHAIAQFRGRVATEHDKRSAVLTLVGILEERRKLVRTEIGRKDEGALFTLANEFAIRHQRRGQQSDYDPAFLDWMFWWYLATIELTDRILDRDDAQPAGAPTPL